MKTEPILESIQHWSSIQSLPAKGVQIKKVATIKDLK